MSSRPIYSVSQASPFAPGIVGLGVSNLPIPVQLLRVTPTTRRAISSFPVEVTVYGQVQNLLEVPVWVRAFVTAVAPDGRTVSGSSMVVALAGNEALEIPAALSLGPLGDWNVVVEVAYSFDGSQWAVNPDNGSTDVRVLPSGGFGPDYACSQTLCDSQHAAIDFRDFPREASWPH